MTRAVRLTALAATIAALPLAALVHNKLLKSLPAAGTTVASPADLRFWFGEKPELALTGIVLKGADSAVVPLGKPAVLAGEKHAVSVPVPQPLKAGAYVVQWKTVGSDGHPLRGSFGFTVK